MSNEKRRLDIRDNLDIVFFENSYEFLWVGKFIVVPVENAALVSYGGIARRKVKAPAG